MKAKPLKIDPDGPGYVQCDPKDATHLRIEIPCEVPTRILPVMIGGTRYGTPNWTWNGDVDKPTLKPSILTTMYEFRCHTWITDGNAIFLNDCSHEFAGQTHELLDVSKNVNMNVESKVKTFDEANFIAEGYFSRLKEQDYFDPDDMDKEQFFDEMMPLILGSEKWDQIKNLPYVD